MIYFRTPETVYLLQTSYTNHNYPFYLPTNPDLSFIYTSELYHKAGNAKSPNLLLPTERKTPQGARRLRSEH